MAYSTAVVLFFVNLVSQPTCLQFYTKWLHLRPVIPPQPRSRIPILYSNFSSFNRTSFPDIFVKYFIFILLNSLLPHLVFRSLHIFFVNYAHSRIRCILNYHWIICSYRILIIPVHSRAYYFPAVFCPS